MTTHVPDERYTAPVDPMEPAPAETDNSARPADGPQDVSQEPLLEEES